jgi:hypothetical protein
MTDFRDGIHGIDDDIDGLDDDIDGLDDGIGGLDDGIGGLDDGIDSPDDVFTSVETAAGRGDGHQITARDINRTPVAADAASDWSVSYTSAPGPVPRYLPSTQR